eukprot:215089_1
MASIGQAVFNSSSSSQSISTAQRLASLGSSIGSLLDGVGVNQKSKEKCDALTKQSIALCDTYNDFTFDTVQVYARPIQQVGAHKAKEDGEKNKTKENAKKASYGYHHALIILSGGHPQPQQYVLDRVEGVRFVKANVIESELI